MPEQPRVGVIIPVLNGSAHLQRLLPALHAQRLAATRIRLIDSESTDGSVSLARQAGVEVEVIERRHFNHGETRNRGARSLTDVDVLVFLTQDALPEDDRFLERLVAPIVGGLAAGAYARQLPYPGASPLEVFARTFNYPSTAHLRTPADIPSLGLRAFFFSNVASAVDRRVFDEVGGFPGDVIMNEDMVICAKILASGRSVAYVADACVRHSHDYSLGQQFRRYFDIGAFLSSNLVGERSGAHGASFAFGQIGWCWRNRARRLIPRCLVESTAKFLGVHLGKRQRWLPRWLKRRCSMHAFHWR